jgi:hypothetical protein
MSYVPTVISFGENTTMLMKSFIVVVKGIAQT